MTWVWAVLSWALCAYLVWRAWPAIRRDLSGLRIGLAGRPRLRRGGRRRAGGDGLL